MEIKENKPKCLSRSNEYVRAYQREFYSRKKAKDPEAYRLKKKEYNANFRKKKKLEMEKLVQENARLRELLLQLA